LAGITFFAIAEDAITAAGLRARSIDADALGAAIDAVGSLGGERIVDGHDARRASLSTKQDIDRADEITGARSVESAGDDRIAGNHGWIENAV